MTELAHHDFIRNRLPAWLLDANPTEQARLRQATLERVRAGQRLHAQAEAIPSLRDFALPRLQPAMDRLFGAPTDLEACRLTRAFRDICATHPVPGGPSTPVCQPHPAETRSLLGWALQNFASADVQAQAFVPGSRFDLKPARAAATQPSPAAFARLCRELDIGAAYQRHLQERLPALAEGTAPLPPLAAHYIDFRRALLAQDAQQARMQGLLDAEGERILAAFGVQLDPTAPVTPLPRAFASGLQLSSRWQVDHPVLLSGVRVFWADRQAARDVVPVVVHIPGDPVAPLRSYPSVTAFQTQLSKRLKHLRYAAFFKSLVPLRDQAWFDQAVVTQVNEGQQHLFSEFELRRDFWQGLYQEWRSATLGNAATTARPVAAIDRNERLDRLEGWLSLGVQLFSVLAMLLPGVTPLALAGVTLGAGQFVLDVYEGIHDLNLGETEQAIQHLFSAALSVGTVAVTGIAANHLVGRMAPVTLADGSERLWHGRIEGFAATRLPPATADVDAFGVWRAGDSAWVRLQDRFYEVTGSGRALRLKLPVDYRGVEPLLTWRRTTGWRWAHRDPLGMQGPQLLREIDPQLRTLADTSLRDAQRLSGVGDDRLRYLAVHGEAMPGVLPYIARRLEARAQVLEAVDRLRSGRPLPSVPQGMVQLLTELPGWPQQRAFGYAGEAGTSAFASGGSGAELRLTLADFAEGHWQERLLAQLDLDEKRALLGERHPWETPANLHQRLAELLADRLESNGYRIIDAFAHTPAQHPDAAIVLRDFPGLPGSILDSLLGRLNAEERRGLIVGRVSPGLAQRVVQSLRELRIARALEAMQAGEAGNDRDRLVMALFANRLVGLEALAEPVRVRLLLDEGYRGAALEAGTQGPLKTIRRVAGRYQPFDEAGHELSTPTSLEDALLRALPDPVRDALGLQIWEQAALRTRLLDSALQDRDALRVTLGLRPSPATQVPPERLLEQRGYPLSSFGFRAWQRVTAESRLQRLYPNEDACATVVSELIERSADTGKTFVQLVSEKEAEWQTLDEGLDAWEHAPGKHHPLEEDDPLIRVSAREYFGRALRQSWRREMTTARLNRPVQALMVDSVRIGQLPAITADFSHVEILLLHDVGLTGDPSAFLQNFPSLRELWLSENRLTHCPVAIGQMRRLRVFNLASNPLVLDDEVFAPMLDAPELENVDLSGVASAGPDSPELYGTQAIASLGRLPKLRALQWRKNLWFTPQQLAAIGESRGLQLLDLTGCRIQLDAQNAAFLGNLLDLELLDLGYNIISDLPDLRALTRLVDVDLSHSRIEVIPQALLDLFQREPAGILSVDLQGNRITDVEPLVPALSRGTSLEEALEVSLDDNPLSPEQIAILRQNGQRFGYTRDKWLTAYAPALRLAFEGLRQTPANARFLDLLSEAVEQGHWFSDRWINSESVEQRGAAFARRFFQIDMPLESLRPRLPDLDERFAAFRKRVYLRLEHMATPVLSGATPPILDELERQLEFFLAWCRSLALREQPAFGSFIHSHFTRWIEQLREVDLWDHQRILNDANRELFIRHLLQSQGEFAQSDYLQYGDLYWYPYLKEMSAEWAQFQAQWDLVGEALTDSLAETVDTSSWPEVLRNNLANPSDRLPGPPLEAVADVDWNSAAVLLNEDQYRRAWAVLRAVRAEQATQAAARATKALVEPWWQSRGNI